MAKQITITIDLNEGQGTHPREVAHMLRSIASHVDNTDTIRSPGETALTYLDGPVWVEPLPGTRESRMGGTFVLDAETGE